MKICDSLKKKKARVFNLLKALFNKKNSSVPREIAFIHVHTWRQKKNSTALIKTYAYLKKKKKRNTLKHKIKRQPLLVTTNISIRNFIYKSSLAKSRYTHAQKFIIKSRNILYIILYDAHVLKFSNWNLIHNKHL